jgi:glyceraldehyde-3-phosphate dehydrogenase (NAD(P))
VSLSRGYAVYTFPDKLDNFKKAGIEPAGTIEDLVKI